MPKHRHDLARNTVIDLHSDLAASRDVVKAIDEQEECTELFKATLVHSTSDLIHLEEAAGLEAMASEAVH